MPIELKCERGKATLGRSKTGQALILTGRRKKWDFLHVCWQNGDTLAIQGLYRGHYGDAVVKARVMAAALEQLGLSERAAEVRPDPATDLEHARLVLATIPGCSAAGMAKQLGVSEERGAELLALAKGGAV